MVAIKKTLITTSLLLATAPAFAFTPEGEDIRYTKNDETFEGYFVAAQGTSKGSVIIHS